jgi:hypothetical protein
MTYRFSRCLRALLVCFIFTFLFFGTEVQVAALETVQTPYSQTLFDNPWQVAFDTVYANGFSLQKVELLADNTWVVHGLVTLPTDAGVLPFIIPDNVADNMLPTTAGTIRPFLTTQAVLLSSIHPTELIELTAVLRTHNFTGTLNTSTIHLSTRVDPSEYDTDSHMALVNFVVHSINFTTPYYDLVLGVALLHSSTPEFDSVHVATAAFSTPPMAVLQALSQLSQNMNHIL